MCNSVLSVHAQVYDMVVAKDGSGEFTTIQAALEKLPCNNEGRSLIFIKDGLYKEKIWLSPDMKNVSLIGESPDGVIISWNDYSGKTAAMSTADSYTFLAEGDGFYAENLTIENTAGEIAQAVAIRTTGDRQIFKNCKFLGFQDTYYAHKKRQYNFQCYIEGATDFIFGDATAVFENCEIHALEGGQYITAPNDTKLISTTPSGKNFYHGLLFLDCLLAADAKVAKNSYYLMRPWGAPASAVFVNSRMGDHINDKGWSAWDGNKNHLSGTFAEYKSKDLSGALLDVSRRADWSRQLTREEMEHLYNLDYFLRKDGEAWNPEVLTISLPAPVNLKKSSFPNTLEWKAVPKARGYVILRDNKVVGFSATNIYQEKTIDVTKIDQYSIKTVSENGNISTSSKR
ncbi:pectinesterase family protein [Autumnicola musiva]|uniref:Pectinesterase n=1 Tax=Autumnicola musiva TaxID=3075589 RepID=A0ABU3D7T2_9FLAO|nr:pectinesterase family protein [Zunongwangia sp. F117]MDT0677593.1 pectinesterase family protein [Zunongwangia sp. F117]